MAPGILARYMARRFLKTVGAMLAFTTLIVFVIDFVEIIRRFSDHPTFTAADGLRLALMRTPGMVETILPFLILFASMAALITMSRSLELVVARASGVSAWRFLAAPVGLAAVIGLGTALGLNPLASDLKDRADAAVAELSGSGGRLDAEGRWFRQGGVDGPSIVHARHAAEDGTALVGVTAFLFEPSGGFREKIVAETARFSNGAWRLSGATVSSATGAPAAVGSYILPTELTEEELRRTLARQDGLSVWSLPAAIETAERTGLNADRYRLAFHSLLGRPLFLAAMVVIAATVSLRLTRYGGMGRLVLTGIGAGFLLYVLTKIVSDLGGNGLIDPTLAAWSPGILALTFGATALLYQEDG